MRSILSAFCLFGSILFGCVFSLTFSSASIIEEGAKAFLIQTIEKKFKEEFSAHVPTGGITQKLSMFKEKYAAQVSSLKEFGGEKYREKIKQIVEKICNTECLKERGLSLSDLTGAALQIHISSAQGAEGRFREFVEGKYYQTIAALLADIRIFSGLNTILFAVLLILFTTSKHATRSLLLPSILLLVATCFSISMYIFGQNWFYTIIFNAYLGYGYLFYVGIIFAMLVDVTFNQARVTDFIVGKVTAFLSCIVPV